MKSTWEDIFGEKTTIVFLFADTLWEWTSIDSEMTFQPTAQRARSSAYLAHNAHRGSPRQLQEWHSIRTSGWPHWCSPHSGCPGCWASKSLSGCLKRNRRGWEALTWQENSLTPKGFVTVGKDTWVLILKVILTPHSLNILTCACV